ncbi:hypothetical protein Tco_0471275 [Tanacetum coccineum]
MWNQEEESFEVEPYNKNLITVDANVQTQESVAANISDRGEIGFRLGDFEAEDNYKSNADLEIPSEEQIAAVTPSARKQLAEPSEQPELQPQAIKRGSKRKNSETSRPLVSTSDPFDTLKTIDYDDELGANGGISKTVDNVANLNVASTSLGTDRDEDSSYRGKNKENLVSKMVCKS